MNSKLKDTKIEFKPKKWKGVGKLKPVKLPPIPEDILEGRA